jgi:hypothetical protein
MHAVEIIALLDERITELAKSRLPEEPAYPSGDAQYASFMVSHEEMNSDKERLKKRENSDKQSPGDWSDDARVKQDALDGSKNRYRLHYPADLVRMAN